MRGGSLYLTRPTLFDYAATTAELDAAAKAMFTLMRDGKLNRGQVQAWALNRYYYQARIPAKDAYLVARLPTPALRREWRRRIIDHDGNTTGTGGIERWLKLAEGVGLDRAYVRSTRGILPGTRFAVDITLSEERVRYMQELNLSLGTQKKMLPYEQVVDASLAGDALKLLG